MRTSSDGVELGVRAPLVLDPPLDLQLPDPPEPPEPLPRCARSLLISVVSADGSESGIGLVLVRGVAETAPERNAVDILLLVGVPSKEGSFTVDFSLDLALVTGCVLLRMLLGVAVLGFDLGLAAA